MDLKTRDSAAFIVQSTSMDDSVIAFESCWVSQFWIPDFVQGDSAFSLKISNISLILEI